MSLLRIFGLGGKKKTSADDVDPLVLAREEMMSRMRSRNEGVPYDPPQGLPMPGDAVAAPAEAAQPVEAPVAETDPLAGLEPAGGALAEEQPQAAGAEPAAPGAGSVPSDLGSDLLDVFRDAKEEAEDGSLAAELEDVSIADLLGDVRGISSRLGVKPSERAPEQAPAPPPEPVFEPEDTAMDEPEPVVQPAIVRQVHIEEPDEEAAEPEMSANPGSEDRYVDPPPGGSGGGAGQTYFMHVLFLGLALALGVGLGIRGSRNGTLALEAGPTPAVLAYLSTPVVPPDPAPVEADDAELKALQKDARELTPSPSPSPSPTPAPTPAPQTRSYPFIPGQPAWMVYAIQSGDSLSSIAEAFEMCPDHILWNNPTRKEEDRLIVGDEMLLPGYRGIVYRMQSGETLAEVAARYSTTVDMALAYPGNGLAGPDEATEGTVVLLPDAIPPSALLQDSEAQWAYTHPSDYGYVWPFYGPITTYYGEERPGYVHYAIDIGGLGHFGAPVLATAEGRVDTVEDLYSGLGRYVVISHPDGSRSVYGHMSDLYVQEGDHVARGEPIGALGCTGHSTGTHLHFELWRNGAPVDPLAYLP